MLISVSANLCSVNIFNIFWSLIISLSVHFESQDGAFFTLSFLSLWPIFDLLCCFPLHARLTFHQARRVETRREQNLRWNDSSIRPHSPRFSTPLPWSPLLLGFLPLSFHLLSFHNPVLLYSTWSPDFRPQETCEDCFCYSFVGIINISAWASAFLCGREMGV